MQSAGFVILRRAGRAILTIWVVVTVVFVFLRVSGDPVRLLLPPTATPEQVEQLRIQLGLDQPLLVQYLHYWQQVVRGNFGESMKFHQPALPLVLDRLPATLQLAAAAFAIAAILGLGLGVTAGLTRGTRLDRLAMAITGVLQAAPSFFLGIMLILIFSVRLGWLPTSGYGTWQQLVLPAVTLGAITAASIGRLTRSSLLDVVRADYVRTAHAKGLPMRAVVTHHELRNAALPIVTILGIELASLMTGAVIVETVFAWPGIGRLTIDSVATRDYPVVQAAVVVIAVVFVVVNLLVDLVYLWLDPRVQR